MPLPAIAIHSKIALWDRFLHREGYHVPIPLFRSLHPPTWTLPDGQGIPFTNPCFSTYAVYTFIRTLLPLPPNTLTHTSSPDLARASHNQGQIPRAA